MPVNCSTTGAVTNAACYTRQTLTPAQQKALLIYAKVAVLVLYSGTDYRTTLASTLLTDASQMVCGITPDGLVAANIAIWMEAAGFTSTALATKMDAIKCLANADPAVLEKADVFLTCKILAGAGL